MLAAPAGAKLTAVVQAMLADRERKIAALKAEFFAIQTSRTGISGGPWTLVVRVKDLPATLRPPDDREAERWTFTVSMWLSNYSARDAIDLLARLASERVPIG